MNYGPDQVRNIPYKEAATVTVNTLVDQCIEKSKKDWNSFEISWDFKKHPLV
jgi:hypothetical protein